MVLASEFEREVPGNLEEEGSCMGFVAGSFVQDKVLEPLWEQHKPGSAKHSPSAAKGNLHKPIHATRAPRLTFSVSTERERSTNLH
jgi:hypothetical protein